MSSHLLHARAIIGKEKMDLRAHASFSCWRSAFMKNLQERWASILAPTSK